MQGLGRRYSIALFNILNNFVCKVPSSLRILPPTRSIVHRSTSKNYSLNQSSYSMKYDFKRPAFTRSQNIHAWTDLHSIYSRLSLLSQNQLQPSILLKACKFNSDNQ